MLGQMCLQPVSELPRNENGSMFALCTFSHFCKICVQRQTVLEENLCDVTEGTWYLSNTIPSVIFRLMLFCLLTGPFLWNVFLRTHQFHERAKSEHVGCKQKAKYVVFWGAVEIIFGIIVRGWSLA